MGIGGRSILRATRGARAAVGLLATASVAGLLSIPSTSSVALVTGGGAGPVADRGTAVVAAGSEVAPVPAPTPSLVAPTTVAPTTTSRPAPVATTIPRKDPMAGAVTAPGAGPGPGGPVAVDTGLWVSRGEAPLQRISPEAGWVPLAWSPGSGAVAMARRGELVILDPVTGTRRPVLHEQAIVRRVAWSPDGRSLAVLSGLWGTPKILVVDLPSGRVARLGWFYGGTSIDHTPEGCLAFGGGLETRADVENAGIVVACPGHPQRLVQGPQGITLQAVFPGVGYVYAQGASDISLMDFEGRPLPGVTGPSLLDGGTDDVGEQLVVDQAGGTIIWAGTSDEGPRGLHASRPGLATTMLSRCSVSAPTASATGTVVYADGCATPGRWSLVRRSPVSGAPRTLATYPPDEATAPLLSPDGRTLVFGVA